MWKGAKMGLERGKKRVGTGKKTGFKRYKKLNLAKFNNLERRGTAVLRRSTFFHRFFLPFQPFFHPFLTIFAKNGKKRSSKIGGTGKERTRSFPVSFPFPVFPIPFHAHLYLSRVLTHLVLNTLAHEVPQLPSRRLASVRLQGSHSVPHRSHR